MSSTSADPFVQFAQWMADAEASEPNDPNAMALATAIHALSQMPPDRLAEMGRAARARTISLRSSVPRK